MQIQLDLEREYGIVLEGGGAKGAYQVGAWKALREAGIKIRGISGASVGALNGALMCVDDLATAEDIWQNISYSRVMDVEDDRMEQVAKRNFKELNIRGLLEDVKRVLSDGGFDIAPLRRLIQDTVDEEVLRGSDRELFVTTYSVSDKKPLTVDVKSVPEGEIGDMLLASAYFLAFKNEELGGKRYRDGGGVNNVPVDVLLDRDYKDIIVIRIYGLGVDTERRVTIPDDANVYHIAPRQYLGGTLEFDAKRARRNMRLGYYDAKRLLYGLAGRRYYIDAPEPEAYYFERLMKETVLVRSVLGPPLKLALGATAKTALSPAVKTALGLAGDSAHEVAIETEPELTGGLRIYTETVLPRLAKELKLKPDWDYRELYLAVLEHLARKQKLERFCIYTAEELAENILSELKKLDSAEPV